MLRRLAVFTIAAAAFANPALAVTLCGPLDGPGCVPDVCSVLDPRPCVGDEDYPFSGDLRVTIETRAVAGTGKPDHDLDTLRDLYTTLRACWTPPAQSDARKDMQMSVRISFGRAGQILSPPRLTYTLPGVPEKVRDAYRNAIAQSLAACAPLHFSKGLGGAIAGRPIMIRYVDDRDLSQQ